MKKYQTLMKILTSTLLYSVIVNPSSALDMGTQTLTAICPQYQKLGSFRTKNFGHAVQLNYDYDGVGNNENNTSGTVKIGIEVPDHEAGIKWSSLKSEFHKEGHCPSSLENSRSVKTAGGGGSCSYTGDTLYYNGLRLWAIYTYNFYACTSVPGTKITKIYGGLT